MATKTKDELKSVFETGDKPTGQDFIDMIDTLKEIYQADEAPTSPQTGDIWVDTAASFAAGESLLVAETVVSGSPVTSVTFSGLDGNADGGYFLASSIMFLESSTVLCTSSSISLKSIFLIPLPILWSSRILLNPVYIFSSI